jgi:hypothetical protein
MSHIVGRGRYARETYPSPPAGAGGGPSPVVHGVPVVGLFVLVLTAMYQTPPKKG